MILEPFKKRFTVLKKNGCNIQFVLDIGAYRGDFSETIKSVWNSAIIWQIEADDRQLPWLKEKAIISLLGNEVKDEVDFYTLDEHKITTGSSIFKELTPHYSPASTVTVKKSMTTIDELNKKHNFFGNWKDLGLVKLDTQGSELLILEGAKNFLEDKEPRYILLECSIQQYNLGAPVFADTVKFLDKLKYKVIDVIDHSYDAKYQLLQIDILFERIH